MQTRRFGRSQHMSSVAIFGAFAIGEANQKEADAAMEMLIEHGVNHIDVAPSYAEAEARLGPWMARERQRFFLGCKTMERSRAGAEAEMQRSLRRLQVEAFDLYQIHAITTFEELDAVTRTGGALEALVAARQAGLTQFLGITGHGLLAPALFLEALQRFDFDSILFPINFVLFGDQTYRQTTGELLRQCRARDVGTMIIKSIAKGPWGDKQHSATTWYEPFSTLEKIQAGVNFVLTQDVSGLCTAGDLQVLPKVLQACEEFTPLSQPEQEALIAEGRNFAPIFA